LSVVKTQIIVDRDQDITPKCPPDGRKPFYGKAARPGHTARRTPIPQIEMGAAIVVR
jgi:hypothetical protein